MRARGALHISERSRATPRLRAVPRAPRGSSIFRRSAHGRGCARTFQLPSFPLGHRRPPTSPPTRRHSSVQSMVHVHPRPRAKAARTDTRSPELGHVGGEHGRTGHRRRARRQRHAVPRAPSCQHKKWRFTVVMHQLHIYIHGCLHSMHRTRPRHARLFGSRTGPREASRAARAERGARPSAPTPRSGRGQRSERSAPPCLVSLHPPRSAHNHRNLRGGDCRLCKCAGSGLCCRVERNATKACRCAPCTRMCGFYL